MGVMQRELKKLKGREAFLRKQDYLDTIIVEENNAIASKHEDNLNIAYLKQLYYGMDRILEVVAEQDAKIDKLMSIIATNKIDTERTERTIMPRVRIIDTMHATQRYIDQFISPNNGRIMWRNCEEPRKLIFAFLKKMEHEGVDITKTTPLQDIPAYRRVFQYVVYNIGSWKEVVNAYMASKNPQNIIREKQTVR